jgi:hypothetical protein
LPSDPAGRAALLSRRFTALTSSIITSLRGVHMKESEARAAVDVPLPSLLATIELLLSCELSSSSLRSFTGSQLSALAFATLLPDLLSSAFDLLYSVVVLVGRRLLPYSRRLSMLIIDVLRRHSSEGYFTTSSFLSSVSS